MSTPSGMVFCKRRIAIIGSTSTFAFMAQPGLKSTVASFNNNPHQETWHHTHSTVNTCSWLSLSVLPLLNCSCYITKVDKPPVNFICGNVLTTVVRLISFQNFNRAVFLFLTNSQFKWAYIETDWRIWKSYYYRKLQNKNCNWK